MDGQDGRDKNEKQEACSLFRAIAMNPSTIDCATSLLTTQSQSFKSCRYFMRLIYLKTTSYSKLSQLFANNSR